MSENLNEPLPISQQDWAYEQLRTDILNSTIAPSSKLQISDLKDRYQTSVGPVREAVSRLAAEGLVVKRGQRGYWAAPASLEEFREITRLRIILEVDALCHSVNNGDLEWEAKVVGAMYRLSSFSTASGEQDDIGDGAYQDENRRFHMALIGKCGFPWQLRFISALYDQTQRYWCLSTDQRTAEQREVEHEDHERILSAALHRDGEMAGQALDTHIEREAQSVISTTFIEQILT